MQYFINFFTGEDMGICVTCGTLFKSLAREKTCPNMKCRLLSGIEKKKKWLLVI